MGGEVALGECAVEDGDALLSGGFECLEVPCDRGGAGFWWGKVELHGVAKFEGGGVIDVE